MLNGNLTLEQHTRVSYWAQHEPPPRAATQADVRENCQHWTLRVTSRRELRCSTIDLALLLLDGAACYALEER